MERNFLQIYFIKVRAVINTSITVTAILNPEPMKRSSVYNEGLPLKRSCFHKGSFDLNLKNIKKYKILFINRNYPEQVIDEQLRRVCSRNREDLFKS